MTHWKDIQANNSSKSHSKTNMPLNQRSILRIQMKIYHRNTMIGLSTIHERVLPRVCILPASAFSPFMYEKMYSIPQTKVKAEKIQLTQSPFPHIKLHGGGE